MIVNQGVLRDTGNVLRVCGPFDEFVVGVADVVAAARRKRRG